MYSGNKRNVKTATARCFSRIRAFFAKETFKFFEQRYKKKKKNIIHERSPDISRHQLRQPGALCGRRSDENFFFLSTRIIIIIHANTTVFCEISLSADSLLPPVEWKTIRPPYNNGKMPDGNLSLVLNLLLRRRTRRVFLDLDRKRSLPIVPLVPRKQMNKNGQNSV